MKYLNSPLSKICFGCEALGGKDWGKFNFKELESAIERSLELGVNFFDTADVYGLGLSEKRLSKILGSRRFENIIATKGGVQWKNQKKGRAKTRFNSSESYIQSAVEDSLRRLKLDVIPIYYIHWPDPLTDISKTFECLEKLRDQGKILEIGCSNFSVGQIHLASEVSELSLLQLPLNLLTGGVSDELSKICEKKKLRIIAYNSLASGLLTGKFNSSTEFSSNDRRSRLEIFNGKNLAESLDRIEVYKEQARKKNMSLTQYSIKWASDNDFVDSVIVGIKTKLQADENLSILN